MPGVRVCGALPEVGLTVSRALSLDVLKLRLPLPVLLRLTGTDAGFDPPCVTVKPTAVGESVKVGGALTVSVTVIVPGDPCAPVAVTVIWPVYVAGVRPAIFAAA